MISFFISAILSTTALDASSRGASTTVRSQEDHEDDDDDELEDQEVHDDPHDPSELEASLSEIKGTPEELVDQDEVAEVAEVVGELDDQLGLQLHHHQPDQNSAPFALEPVSSDVQLAQSGSQPNPFS